VLVVAALMGVTGCHPPAGSSSSPSAASPVLAERSGDGPGRLQARRHTAPSAADGEVPDNVTVNDDRYPAVTRLDPRLLRALRTAARAAAGDGVELFVNSGWRSEKYQAALFEQAVWKYGSEAKAAQWVARPGTSVHESGDAVDIGPDDAATWLSEHGAGYGLCQTYGNEPWHFELRPEAVHHGCPPTYADPTHDPRMQ
jgi:zinc D-Ala-D-Ala carboxypeptidase